MITEKDYLRAKKIIQEYENKQLNISDVRKSVCKHEGKKDYSEGFGFFCLDCGKHI